ncbi:hypothetical protein NM208_g12046 [Fusarium decemcellulare]|uniref:Uncharacterized protein n=1 Tax=Fusarium decemcellulare TaxID=57161 RepID=A0ACC1RQK5_9HYPO|nr:hypothetical protein NM208_g12046 [Fusarium decemcellulare]
MTVREWIYHNAEEAEKKLKHDCTPLASRPPRGVRSPHPIDSDSGHDSLIDSPTTTFGGEKHLPIPSMGDEITGGGALVLVSSHLGFISFFWKIISQPLLKTVDPYSQPPHRQLHSLSLRLPTHSFSSQALEKQDTMLGLSFTTFVVPVPKADGFWGSFIFPRRRPSTEIQYLETLEAGMFDEPLDARRRGLGLTDW